MLARFGLVALAVMAMIGAAHAKWNPDVIARLLAEAEKDAPMSQIHPFTDRYEGSFILGQTVKVFDERVFPAGPTQEKFYDKQNLFTKTVTAQGKVTRTAYLAPEGRSSLAGFRNYRNAVAAKGFEPVYKCAGATCGKEFYRRIHRKENPASSFMGKSYSRDREKLLRAFVDKTSDVRYALFRKAGAGGDDWVAIYAGLNMDCCEGPSSSIMKDRVGVLVQVVQAGVMEDRMVTLKAEDITSDIAKQGRAVLYGILFDFDKADIKAESEPQLAEMAKALKADPRLRVFIVGHTDNQGKLDYNTGLSQRRAEAVVKALSTKHAIPAARMMAKGLASLAPVATNRTEDGRAKNRRVEMVEQ